MKVLRNIWHQLPSLLVWALFSFMFWSWIFILITDVSPKKKVSIFCCVPEMEETDLMVELEKEKPEGIKMIKAYTFDYEVFNIDRMENGDIFIVPEAEIEKYERFFSTEEDISGTKIYDAQTGEGAAVEYISYTDDDYYLFLGNQSGHIEDGAAEAVAEHLLRLTK